MASAASEQEVCLTYYRAVLLETWVYLILSLFLKLP